MDFTFLEWCELASSCLKMQLSSRVVKLALLTDALVQRRKLPLVDILEQLVSAGIAGVGVDLEQRLDIGDSRNDSSNGDELA